MTGYDSKRQMASDKVFDLDGYVVGKVRKPKPAQEQWKCVGPPCKCNASNAKQCCYAVFTTPPKREWVELTKDEIESWDLPVAPTVAEFAWFVESKIKEKNT